MDIRIEKTERAIKNAFLELRSRKPLGKITVKELCSLAAINKSTFYSHYEGGVRAGHYLFLCACHGTGGI